MENSGKYTPFEKLRGDIENYRNQIQHYEALLRDVDPHDPEDEKMVVVFQKYRLQYQQWLERATKELSEMRTLHS